MKKIQALLALSTLFLLTSCYQEPTGPAEQIGRGVDDILQGSQKLNDQYGAPIATPTPYIESQQPPGNVDNSRYDYNSDAWWREHDKQMQHEAE